MAFTTTQVMDNALLRGLNFRLPNNAPISSLYTLYANGQGQTFWSNSINPMHLSTLSTSLGTTDARLSGFISTLDSTIKFQSTQIDALFKGQTVLSTSILDLSTSIGIAYNSSIQFMISSVNAISSVSSFQYLITLLSNDIYASLSSMSTSVGIQNTSTFSTLTFNYNTAIAEATTSSIRFTGSQISTISTLYVPYTVFQLDSTFTKNQTQSSATGLHDEIVSSFVFLSTGTAVLNSSLVSSLIVSQSTMSGALFRIEKLETLSTNLSSITGDWISSAISTSEANMYSTMGAQVTTLSTIISSFAGTFLSTISTISTIYSDVSTVVGITYANQADISTLTKNFSTLTTSSILASIYDTFMALEDYTSTLINSTILTVAETQSTIYYSTLVINQSTTSSYYTEFLSNMFYSTVTIIVMSTNIYTSSILSSVYSTGYYAITSTLTSTAAGLTADIFQQSIYDYISTPAGQMISTTYAYSVSTIGEISTVSISSIVGITAYTTLIMDSIETSTISSYNSFVSTLNYTISSGAFSTFYTYSALSLNSTNFSATMDLTNVRNHRVKVYDVLDNISSYKLDYKPKNLADLQYRRGVVTIDISTVGKTYTRNRGQLRFDVYRWGVPTTVWGNVYPYIGNADYSIQYEYTIISNTVYTNLLGVYPNIHFSNFRYDGASNVFMSGSNTYVSNIAWRGSPVTFRWDPYAFLPAGFGGAPFDPQLAIDIFNGSNLYDEVGTYSLLGSTATITMPPAVGGARSTLFTLAARIVGSNDYIRSTTITSINPVFDTITLYSAGFSNGSNILCGSELVAITQAGNFPLYNASPSVYVAGGTPGTYFNDSRYAPSNLTNGILNQAGTPIDITYSTTAPPTTPALSFYENTMTNPRFYVNYPNVMSNFAAVVGASPFLFRVQNTAATKSVVLSNAVLSNVGGGIYSIIDTTVAATSNTFTVSGETCTFSFGYALPDTWTPSNERYFIGNTSNMDPTANWAAASNIVVGYSNVVDYFSMQNTTTNAVTPANTLTLASASASFSTIGKVGTYSLAFDGTANSYATLGSNVGRGGTNFSLSAWIYWYGTESNSRVYSFSDLSGATNYAYLTPNSNGLLQAVIGYGGTQCNVVWNQPLPSNAWTHLAVVYDSPGNQGRLYVNGTRIGAGLINNISMSNIAGVNNYLATDNGGVLPMFRGLIDDLIIWKTALDDGAIESIYNTQRQPRGYGQSLTYSISGTDAMSTIVFYNMTNSNIVGSDISSNMNGAQLTLSMTLGSMQYRSTLVMSGAATQRFRL